MGAALSCRAGLLPALCYSSGSGRPLHDKDAPYLVHPLETFPHLRPVGIRGPISGFLLVVNLVFTCPLQEADQFFFTGCGATTVLRAVLCVCWGGGGIRRCKFFS
jgi:hypothetical protein